MDWHFFFTFFLFIICFGYLYSLFAILMEVYSFNQYRRRVDIFRLMITGLSEPFYFHPFVVWSGIMGFANLITNKKGWGEMTRQGFKKKTSPVKPLTLNSDTPSIPKKDSDEEDWLFEKKVLPILNSVSDFITALLKTYIPLVLTLALLFIATRSFEIIANSMSHGIPTDFFKVLPIAFAKDLLFWAIVSIRIFPIYSCIYLIHKKTAKLVFVILSILLLLVQVSLSQYFISTLVLLGADLWGYSIADIRQTVGASGGLPILLIVAIVLLIAISISAFIWMPKKIKLRAFDGYVFVLLLMVLFLTPTANKIAKWIPGQEFSNNLVINKSQYFLSASFQHFFPSLKESDIYAENYMGGFQIANAGHTMAVMKYVDEKNFPFLHVTDSTADVLSPYFKKSYRAPNIVIILVEGLGRAFTNRGAYLGNFTPNVDSLASKSLYWENFLSEGGRTFAALPSILSSLTFAKNGFNELGESMPKHFSLMNLLQQNGYRTSFYYGGDGSFDNMNLFLSKNSANAIMDEPSFPAGVIKMPQTNGFSWGYGDQELFQHYLKTNTDSTKPNLSVILTVSTHSPFKINEQEKYLQRFEARMTELNFSESMKTQYRFYSYQYASILYTDEKIGDFIRAYQSRPDFKNTVFLITGDHRMPEIPMSSKIDRYHVPLIIYSPLLNRTAKFSSVSTHFDITPSLLAWLKHSYQLQLPDTVSWMGTGLDTSRGFRNTHAYPMMQTKTDIIDFVQGDWLINANVLYRINNKMELTMEDNQSKANELKAGFERFKSKNDQFLTNLKLLPDSLLAHYLPK
jgi:phosphoglycerol transferase MdoB-like AlkP superfamily enzyme